MRVKGRLVCDICAKANLPSAMAIVPPEGYAGDPRDALACFACFDSGKAESAPPRLPPPGSWAETARFMAATGGDGDGVDWDDWKDRNKEGR